MRLRVREGLSSVSSMGEGQDLLAEDLAVGSS